MTQEEPKTMTAPTMRGKEALIWIARGEYFSFRAKVYRLAETGEIIEQRGDDWYTAKEDINDIIKYGVYAVYFNPSKPVERKEDEYTEKRRKFVLSVSDYHGNRTLTEMILEFVEAEFQRKEKI